MKKISLFILVLVSFTNVFAMEESNHTDCKNMVQSNSEQVSSVAAPVVREESKKSSVGK